MYIPYCLEIQEFYLRSQAVQRNLPRPSDINTTILRGTLHPEQKMKSLYEVCIQAVMHKVLQSRIKE